MQPDNYELYREYREHQLKLKGILTLCLLRCQEEEFRPVIPLQLVLLVSIGRRRRQWHIRQFMTITRKKSQQLLIRFLVIILGVKKKSGKSMMGRKSAAAASSLLRRSKAASLHLINKSSNSDNK